MHCDFLLRHKTQGERRSTRSRCDVSAKGSLMVVHGGSGNGRGWRNYDGTDKRLSHSGMRTRRTSPWDFQRIHHDDSMLLELSVDVRNGFSQRDNIFTGSTKAAPCTANVACATPA